MKKREEKHNTTPEFPHARVFKECTMCGKRWSTKDEFLGDEEVHLNGYQWNKKKLRLGEDVSGLLIFTHVRSNCCTTLGIEARKFRVSWNSQK